MYEQGVVMRFKNIAFSSLTGQGTNWRKKLFFFFKNTRLAWFRLHLMMERLGRGVKEREYSILTY